MEAYTPSEQQSAEVSRTAHLGRIAERIDRIATLKSLLSEEDATTVVAALRQGGYSVEGDGFDENSLEDLRTAITGGVEQMEAWNNEVAGLAKAVKSGLVGAVARPESNESLEKLTDVERACLEAMREDFDRGIVLIDENANNDAYKAALEKDKAAKQSWETVQGRLLANDAALLKEAVELSKRTGGQEGKGACLVGVYENGELAIRQRSQEIVNVIRTKEGQLRLAFHPEAKLEEGEQWAKAVEIVRAVKAAGYHVPADAPGYKKRGHVAASEAVTGADYVASPNRDEWRDVMLECPDNVSDDAGVRVVVFLPANGNADVYDDFAGSRFDVRGAVLWLRG